jgi:hypothetical protein
VNLGTARIVILAALVVAGAVVLAQGFGAGGGDATQAAPNGPAEESPTESPEPSPQESPSAAERTPEPNTKGIVFEVFNGTEETGLAGEWQQFLASEGQIAARDASDSPIPDIPKTILYFRGGDEAAQNKSDATYLSDTYFDAAPVKKLGADFSEAVAPDTQVLIVLGANASRPPST